MLLLHIWTCQKDEDVIFDSGTRSVLGCLVRRSPIFGIARHPCFEDQDGVVHQSFFKVKLVRNASSAIGHNDGVVGSIRTLSRSFLPRSVCCQLGCYGDGVLTTPQTTFCAKQNKSRKKQSRMSGTELRIERCRKNDGEREENTTPPIIENVSDHQAEQKATSSHNLAKEKCQDLQNQLTRALDAHLEAEDMLKRELRKTEHLLDTAAERLYTMRLQLKVKTEDYKELLAEFNSNNNNNNRVLDMVPLETYEVLEEKYATSVSSLELELQQAQKSKASLQADLDMARRSAEQYATSVSNLELELEQAKESKASLQTDLDMARRSGEQHATSVSSLELELEQAKKSKASLQADLDMARRSAEQYATSVSNLELELEQAKESKASLQTDLDMARRSGEQHATSVSSLELELEQAKKSKASLQTDLDMARRAKHSKALQELDSTHQLLLQQGQEMQAAREVLGAVRGRLEGLANSKAAGELNTRELNKADMEEPATDQVPLTILPPDAPAEQLPPGAYKLETKLPAGVGYCATVAVRGQTTTYTVTSDRDLIVVQYLPGG
ncbi:Hypp2995 [Branchiostoma lanceolatum]|uniref:Hypp2995 protein n=1 Tax=Branchiostoma lanceolatum TaxID=7740 RepID=A0A8J9ZYU5_BRALA|nr:Hypp2995 [Branchiostoma lanceolatum]